MSNDNPIWPRPQEMKLTGEMLSLKKPLTIRVDSKSNWLSREADTAAEFLNAAAGRKVVAAKRSPGSPVLILADSSVIDVAAGGVARAEGYSLSVKPRAARLCAADGAGLHYGLQTLSQLLRVEKGAAPGIATAVIRDWPRFPIRGAHVFLPSKRQMPFFFKWIDYLSSLKYNTLFLELAAGMEFKRHPEINVAWRRFYRLLTKYDARKDPRPDTFRGNVDYKNLPRTQGSAINTRYFPKDGTHLTLGEGEALGRADLKKLIEHCRARHVEIIPEVQSLGHCYWLCVAHPEIREREDDPFPDTYCPSNPRTYELLFDVMDEVVEVFQPRWIHIGHDECYTYGVCPTCRERSGPSLLGEDVKKLHAHLASRGVKTMLWGDGLIDPKVNPLRKDIFPRRGGVADRRRDPITGKLWTKPEVWPAVRTVPKDVMIVDWYWEYEEKSEYHFASHGLKQIYGNFSPFLCEDWEQRTQSGNVLGAEVSSWCAPTAEAFSHNGVPHFCFLTADLLWQGRQMEREQAWRQMAAAMPAALDFLAGQERWLSGGRGKVAPIDLSDLAELLPHVAVGRLKTGSRVRPVTCRGVFEVQATANGYLQKALILDRVQRRLVVPVAKKATRLLVLQGTTMTDVPMEMALGNVRQPALLVRYTVKYADGREDGFDARFGRHIAPIFDSWPMPGRRWIWAFCHEAVPVALEGCFKLFAQEWPNPRPGAVIESLTLELPENVTAPGEVLVPAISLVR